MCACKTPQKAPQTSAELERSSFTIPSPVHVQYLIVWTGLIILSDGLKQMELVRGVVLNLNSSAVQTRLFEELLLRALD